MILKLIFKLRFPVRIYINIVNDIDIIDITNDNDIDKNLNYIIDINIDNNIDNNAHIIHNIRILFLKFKQIPT